MTKRIVLAGLCSGIAMFIWSSIAHVATPLGGVGFSEIQNEGTFLTAMHSTLGEKHGLYLFPAGGDATDAAAMQQYAQKIANGPSGILIYHPSGAQALAPAQLATEFLTEVIEAFLAVVLLAQTRLEGFGPRVGFVAIAGILASITTNISYWNWYGFPASYTFTYMSIQIVGFVVAGVVASIVMKTRTTREAELLRA